MTGYVRQSTSEIVAGQVVLATPLSAEFNELQAAFHATTGHSHDASAGNGPKISLTTSVSGILPPANGGVGAALTTVDNTIPRFNGVAGVMQTSSAVITDAGGLTLTTTDDGATAGPLLDLVRDSASPAASDILSNIRIQGKDSAGNLTTYADMFTQIVDPTDSSEDGSLTLRIAIAGTLTNRFFVNSAGVTLGGTTTLSGMVLNTVTTDDAIEYPIGATLLVQSSNDLDLNAIIVPKALDENSNGTYKIIADTTPSSGTWATTANFTGVWRTRGRTAGMLPFTYAYFSERVS